MAFLCPECGRGIGKDTDSDAYSHAIACLNMPAGDTRRLAGEYKNKGGENAKRVLFLLDEIERENTAVATAITPTLIEAPFVEVKREG